MQQNERFAAGKQIILTFKVVSITAIFVGIFFLVTFFLDVPLKIIAKQDSLIIGILALFAGFTSAYILRKMMTYFVELTRDGINIENKQFINWLDVSQISTGKDRDDKGSVKKHVEIYHYKDETKQKVIMTTVPLYIDWKNLYDSINRRLSKNSY